MQRMLLVLVLLIAEGSAYLPEVSYRRLGRRAALSSRVGDSGNGGTCSAGDLAKSHRRDLARYVVPASNRGGSSMEATPVPILVVLGMLVGALASLVSVVYGILLSSLVNLVWRELPALCSAGPWYITAATTIGAVSVALLASTCLPLKFVTPTDFISSFRKPDPATEFGKQLAAVLILSLIVSVSGFSLGPEAPMIIAGGSLGSLLATRFGLPQHKQAFAAAGAAGALSSFLTMPFVGAVFLAELVFASARAEGKVSWTLDMKVWAPACAASLVAVAVKCLARGQPLIDSILGIFRQNGHFKYSHLSGKLGAQNMVSLVTVIPVALVAKSVTSTMQFFLLKAKTKINNYNASSSSATSSSSSKLWARVRRCAVAGILVGVLGTLFPQTLLWGETRLQSICLDGQRHVTSPDLHPQLTAWSLVPTSQSLTPSGATFVGLAKILSIGIALATGVLPGGPFIHTFIPYIYSYIMHYLSSFISLRLFILSILSILSISRWRDISPLLCRLSACTRPRGLMSS